MPRGGKREGAGRRPNVPNKATQERQKRVAASGVTPLEVMLDNMRFAHSGAAAIVTKLSKVKVIDGEGIQLYRELMRLRIVAQDCAKDAAPYVHPKLQAIEHFGDPERPIKEEVTHKLDKASAALIAGLVK